MQNTASANRIRVQAHSQSPKLALGSGQLVLEDLRLRNWRTAYSGFSSDAYDVAVCVTGDGNILRVRTIGTNKIDVAYATPADTLVWTTVPAASYSGGVVYPAQTGQGVSVNCYGATVNIFWIHTDGLTIKTARSVDNGHTWGAPRNVGALGLQMTNTKIRLAAATDSVLFITDTRGGGTQVLCAVTPNNWTSANVYTWDLGWMDLGIAQPPSVHGLTPSHSTIGAASLESNRALLTFYAGSPRNFYDSGLYSIEVHIADGLRWGQLTSIYGANEAAAVDPSIPVPPKLQVSHPKMQIVGDEFWITALETSSFAGHAVAHLAVFRSLDGVHWSDRYGPWAYLAGTDLETADLVPHQYSILNFMFGQVVVCGVRTFLVGYDWAYMCGSTALVGVSNPAKQLDITRDAHKWTLSLAGTGQAGVGRTSLKNRESAYNYGGVEDILRRGARLTRKAGYWTMGDDGLTPTAETVTIATELVDEVGQATGLASQENKDDVEVQSRDNIKLLQDWRADVFHEYTSPTINKADKIPDLSGFTVANGSYNVNSGVMYPGILDTDAIYPDNLAYLLQHRTYDGVMEIKFMCASSWSGNYGGIAFLGVDNQNYYAVLYNRVSGQFTLHQATASTSGNIIVTYGAALASHTVALATDAWYRMRVHLWHDTVFVSYRTEAGDFNFAFSYSGLPVRTGYWGIVSKGNLTPATPVGDTTTNVPPGPNYFPMFDPNINNPISGWGTAFWMASRVQAGPAGVLRAVNIAWGRYVSVLNEAMPDLRLYVVKSNADGSAPADFTNPANQLFVTVVAAVSLPVVTMSALEISSYPVAGVVPTEANKYYWIVVEPVANVNNAYYHGAYVDTYFPGWFWRAPGDPPQRSLYTYQQNQVSWVQIGTAEYCVATSRLGASLSISAQSSGLAVASYSLTTGETAKTLEYLSQEIATKAGVMGFESDSFLTDDFASLDIGVDGTQHNWCSLVTGTFGINAGRLEATVKPALMRSNSFWGSVGDVVIDAVVQMESASTMAFLLRCQGGPPATGYAVFLLPDGTHTHNGQIALYRVSGVALDKADFANVRIPVGVPFRVKVIQKGGYFLVYINDCFAWSTFDTNITTTGYVGLWLNSGTVYVDSLRIADMSTIQDYFAIQAKKDGKSALDELLNKRRVQYFIKPDGTLRISHFRRRASVDTYSATLKDAKRTDSDKYWVSDIEPEGARYARRFSPSLIDSDGRRFVHEDYTDAFTDQVAYEDARYPLRYGEEMSRQYEFTCRAVPVAEREDVITVVNPKDGTNETKIINNLDFAFQMHDTGPDFTMHVGLRDHVEEV